MMRNHEGEKRRCPWRDLGPTRNPATRAGAVERARVANTLALPASTLTRGESQDSTPPSDLPRPSRAPQETADQFRGMRWLLGLRTPRSSSQAIANANGGQA